MRTTSLHRALRVAALSLAAAAPTAGTAWADTADPSTTPPARTVGVAVPAGQIEAAVAALDGLAAAMLERSGVPGLAVAVVHQGKTVYARGFGVRKVGEQAAVDADTVFQVASLSKSISATVVATQVGEGRVSWNTPVVAQLPWFGLAAPWVGEHVTIGDLFAHRSGLPDHAGDDLEDLGFGQRAIFERLRAIPLEPFRITYAYTNMGLSVAALAVAAAAGEDWATLSEKALYEPLGMTTASSRYSDFAARGNRAYGHVKVDGHWEARFVRQPDAQAPAGGVSASVEDMAKWMALVLGEGDFAGRSIIPADALLPAVTAQIISSPSQAPDARPGFYGYGFGVGIEPSGRVSLSHSGAFLLGAGTTYLMLPSLDLGIVVLSNAAPVGAVEALAREFMDLVQYGTVTRDWYAGYHGLMAGLYEPVGALAGEDPPTDPEPALPLADYAGDYANDYVGDLMIERRTDGLVLVVGPSRLEFPLTHWDGDRFVFPISNENAPPGSRSTVDFRRASDGTVGSVEVEYFDQYGTGSFGRRG